MSATNGHTSDRKSEDDAGSTKSLDGEAILEKLDILVSAVTEITDCLKDNEAVGNSSWYVD